MENVMDAINQLITQSATNVPVPTLPTLDLQLPSGQDLDAKWREFLDRAAKDPDIINYYQNLLNQGKGDTKLAIAFLEKDYEVGTRQVKDNLSATLEQLGLTERGENQNLATNLNQRGIAMTVNDAGNIEYAGGGQAKTELGQLNDAQRFRREAEERSARQKIEPLGLTREKGITEANQGLTNTAMGLQKAKEQDVLNRGQTYYNLYQNKINADAQAKIQNPEISSNNQSSVPALTNPDGSDTELGQLYKIGGQRNPVQESRFRELGGR